MTAQETPDDLHIDVIREKLLTADGHLLILGGPGCGKTTIALRKAQTALDGLLPEQRVLFLSFSRAAVRQITERMDKHLAVAARSALEVRTFHAYFLDVVRSHGRLLTGAQPTVITPDRERIMKADHPGDWPAERQRLAVEDSRYVFDLLAPTAAELLERSAAIRDLYSDIYPLIIVDEFQDTNSDQWRAVKALAATSTIICLADADQRIFDYIDGVDEHRIAQAVEELNPATFDLSADNFRSPGSGLLDYANAVLRNRPMRPPEQVNTLTYPPNVGAERAAQFGVVRLRTELVSQLGHVPSIAVLAISNALPRRRLRRDVKTRGCRRHATPGDRPRPDVDPQLSAAAGVVAATVLLWPSLDEHTAVLVTLEAVADYFRTKLGGLRGGRGSGTARTALNQTTLGKSQYEQTGRCGSRLGRSVLDAVRGGVIVEPGQPCGRLESRRPHPHRVRPARRDLPPRPRRCPFSARATTSPGPCTTNETRLRLRRARRCHTTNTRRRPDQWSRAAAGRHRPADDDAPLQRQRVRRGPHRRRPTSSPTRRLERHRRRDASAPATTRRHHQSSPPGDVCPPAGRQRSSPESVHLPLRSEAAAPRGMGRRLDAELRTTEDSKALERSRYSKLRHNSSGADGRHGRADLALTENCLTGVAG